MGTSGEIRHITKWDFLNYFKSPRPLWFLLPEEMVTLLADGRLSEEVDELQYPDYISLLQEIVESPEEILKENSIRLNQLKNKKILDFYRNKFKLPNLSIYDHSSFRGDSTEQTLQLLKDPKLETVFIYKPTLVAGDVKVIPTALYKYKGKIYLLEHFWSTTLKREAMAHFVLHNHFFTKLLNFKIDQYLISYLSAEPSPNKELLVKFTNSLPFTAQSRAPEGLGDERMKNINTFFDLWVDYLGSLYQCLFDEDDFDSINNEPWEITDEELLDPEVALQQLREFLANPNRDLDLFKVSEEFMRGKGNMIPSQNPLYKSIFTHLLPSFDFSSALIPLLHVLCFLRGCPDDKRRISFLDYTSNFKFITGFPQDQDYIIFPEAIETFNDLQRKSVKVYYDFETVSFPFPYLENTKAHAQIVLQLSLIVVRDGKEQKPTTNIILDPLDLSLDALKGIIDAIYLAEPGVVYIVYNQCFENTRLKEMAELINEEEYRQKVVEIIDRTVDLANWFTYGNKPRIIHRKLKGFHSIKKVNKIIPEEIERETGTKKYSDLKKCQNGVMAQAMLLSRALVTDPEQDKHNWDRNREFMYRYCENDVRSMIAVERYIDKLIKENKYPLQDPKKFQREKLAFRRMKMFA